MSLTRVLDEMPFSLPSAVMGASLSSLVLAFAMYLLSRAPGAMPGLRNYSAAFAVNIPRYWMLLAAPVIGDAWASLFSEALHSASTILLIAGTSRFFGRILSARVLILVWGVAVAWAFVAIFLIRDFLALAVPLYMFGGLALLLTAWAFLRERKRQPGIGYGFAAAGFFLWGLHKFDYPWLAPINLAAPFGLALTELLSVTLAITLIVVSQRQQKLTASQTSRVDAAIEELFHDVNQRLLQDQRSGPSMTFLCERLAEIFALPLVWIGAKAGDGRVLVEAVAGDNEAYVRSLDLRWKAAEAAQGPVSRAISQGTTQIVDTADPTLKRARDAGFRAIAAIPLQARQRVVGALNVYTYSRFDETLVQRFELLGRRLGLAVQVALDQQRLRLQGAAMASAANAILIADSDGRIEWANDAFTRQSGFTAEEARGERPSFLQPDSERAVEVWAAISDGRVWRGELVERRKDGRSYSVDQTITPMRDEKGRIAHYVIVHEDITDRKLAEERITYMSNYDMLTSLPNRTLLRDRLAQAVVRAEAGAGRVALLFIDLDDFSRINDTLGHEAGDRMLRVVVDRLKDASRTADTLARVGGDEFAVVLADAAHAEVAAGMAERLLAALTQPCDIDGQEVRIGASIGIALYPGDGDDAEHLIRNADVAMYRAIHEAPNSYRFFSSEMDVETQARLRLERDLRRALGRHEFVLHYQPQVDVRSGRIVGFEALLRWRHAELGVVPPGHFIGLSEDSGLIIPIGEWVLHEACAQVRRWRDGGVPVVPVAVNISAVQMRHQDIIACVEGALRAGGIEAGLLELELTESAVMQDAQAAIRVLDQIKALGVRLAIDDFGTGYSSLSYLKKFPVDMLKIDQSFIHDLTTDPNDAEIAHAIITLGHSLNLKVLSEGVETAAHLDYLRGAGCDVAQGYLFSRPVPADEAAALLKAQPYLRS